jgi:hypothetical protein
LTLDFDAGRYEVRAMTPSNESGVADEFVEEWGPLARDETLPDGVRIATIETPTALAASGTVDLFFHPESDVPGAKITLVDDADGTSVLVFDGVTGRVYIADAAGPASAPAPAQRPRAP